MSIPRYAASLIAAVTLAACTSQPSNGDEDNTTMPIGQAPSTSAGAASGLSSAEAASLKQAIIQKLSNMDVADDYGRFAMHCRQGFSLGEPTILDSSLMGESGKVRISVPVKFLGAVDRGSNVVPRYYIPSNECYGAPPGGWTAGMISTSTYEVNIEKWQTGWRPTDQQKLVPTR